MSTLKGLLLCALLSASAMALPRIVETSEPTEHEDAAQNGDEEHEDDRFTQIYAEIEEVRYHCPAVAEILLHHAYIVCKYI